MKKFLCLVIPALALATTSSAFAGDFTCKKIVKVPAEDVKVVTVSQFGQPQQYLDSAGNPMTVTTTMPGSYCAD